METKENNRFKPFDLEQAKAGKPVCTRDRHKARIICFDAKISDNYPIIALVESIENPGSESLYSYSHEGRYRESSISELDLVMISEKKEGGLIYTPVPMGKQYVQIPTKQKKRL